MSTTLTVTSKAGPSRTLTAVPFCNVGSFEVDFVSGRLTIHQLSPNLTTNVELDSITTVTWTIAGKTHSIVMS
jgi:hypothetical protein